MKYFLDGVKYGISYFSILPIKLDYFEANKSFYKGVLYSLPLVGLLLSLIVVSLYILAPLPQIYKAILCSVLYLFLYGFLHLEAVADTIDGYFASLSKKDVYEVMKEPYIGSIGAIGTFCFVLLKILALSYLLYLEEFLYIILTLILSRVTVFFALQLEFHEKSDFINSLKDSYSSNIILELILFPIVISTKYILNKLKKNLGFLNGDTLGFNIEFQEIVLLNIAIILAT